MKMFPDFLMQKQIQHEETYISVYCQTLVYSTWKTYNASAATQFQTPATEYFNGCSSVMIKGVQGPKFQIPQSPFWLLFVQPIGILTPCFSGFELQDWKSRTASLNTLSVGQVLRISVIILRFQCSVAVQLKL